jgi:hypothetical protein
LNKFNPKYLFTGLLTVIFFTQTWKTTANYNYNQNFYIALTAQQDTVPIKTKDSLIKRPPANDADTLKKDSLLKTQPTDTSINKIDTFDLKISKDSLDAPSSMRPKILLLYW